METHEQKAWSEKIVEKTCVKLVVRNYSGGSVFSKSGASKKTDQVVFFGGLIN